MSQMKMTDEMLTAYLDGELDEAQRLEVENWLAADANAKARLDALAIDTGQLAVEYMTLSQDAPLEELQMSMVAATETPAVHEKQSTPWMKLAAACVAVIAISAGAFLAGSQVANEDKSWREAVAEYQVLYTQETLTWNSVAANEVDTTLGRLSDRMGVQLERSKLAIDGAKFRRGQMLKFEGEPLVQLAYLHGTSVPLAFCLTREDGKPDVQPAYEKREGLPIVHWRSNGVGYMVIADLPEQELMQMASVLKTRF